MVLEKGTAKRKKGLLGGRVPIPTPPEPLDRPLIPSREELLGRFAETIETERRPQPGFGELNPMTGRIFAPGTQAHGRRPPSEQLGARQAIPGEVLGARREALLRDFPRIIEQERRPRALGREVSIGLSQLERMGQRLEGQLPGTREFTTASQEVAKSLLPLNKQGEQLLASVRFKPMPGEPGWADAAPWQQMTRLGFAADPATIIHEFLHNADPSWATGGEFDNRLAVEMADYVVQNLRTQGRDEDADAFSRLAERDPVHVFTEAMMNPIWGIAGQPIPDDFRESYAPFIEQGAVLRDEWTPASSFRGELLRDIAQDPASYRDISERDPGFFQLMFERMGEAMPGVEHPAGVRTTPGEANRGLQGAISPGPMPLPVPTEIPRARGRGAPGLASPDIPPDLEEAVLDMQNRRRQLGLPPELLAPRIPGSAPPPVHTRRPTTKSPAEEERARRGIFKADVGSLSDEELGTAIEDARRRAQTPFPRGATEVPVQTPEQAAAQREFEELLQEQMRRRAAFLLPAFEQQRMMLPPTSLIPQSGQFLPNIMPELDQNTINAMGMSGVAGLLALLLRQAPQLAGQAASGLFPAPPPGQPFIRG